MAMDTTTPASRRSLPSMSVLGPIIALVALVVIGALLNPNFLGAANITNVLARSAFIGIIAVGMTFVITAGGLDLSVVIRTFVRRAGRAHLHVGGGIVADSSPEAEYLESLDKARAPLSALEEALSEQT